MYSCYFESKVTFLTIERAKALVPPEFLWAWEWFSNPENLVLPNLPMGKYAPYGAPLKLASESGIHSPNYQTLPSKGNGKKKYALSIHSSHKSYYSDKQIVDCEDGTWIFEYCEHRKHYGDSGKKQFNDYLRNCMEDGVPVAVLLQNASGQYDNKGLAFVEEYDAIGGIFILHGPATAAKEDPSLFAVVTMDDFTPEEQLLFQAWDDSDERVRETVERAKRQGQSRFRDALMAAYDGHCALTQVDVPEVLQAAHIRRFRGTKSQTVNCGILLRADIHLLYDAHLLGVEPVNHRIHLAPALYSSAYSRYRDATLEVPANPREKPNENLLGMQYEQFERLIQRVS